MNTDLGKPNGSVCRIKLCCASAKRADLNEINHKYVLYTKNTHLIFFIDIGKYGQKWKKNSSK